MKFLYALPGHEFHFEAPTGPQQEFEVIKRGSSKSASVSEDTQTVRGTTSTRLVKLQFKPTNFNQEWRTPPLWAVSDSALYMHDGRAETLLEAIAMHDGEAAGTRDGFLNLSLADRQVEVAFLNTLVAPTTAPERRN